MTEIILLVFAISFAIFITVGQTKLLYRRHLKSYRMEIETYLKSHGFTLEDSHSPNKNDWNNSPFVKPPVFRLSLVVISINGSPVTWTDKKYKIIETLEGKRLWLEIETTYFRKPILTFKFGKKEKPSRTQKLHSQNIISVTEKCPACGQHLSENELECPDCGLNFR